MASEELRIRRFKSEEDRSRVTSRTQGQYRAILETLAKFATEVESLVTTEEDAEYEPHLFYASAKHRFIMPPQPNLELTEESFEVQDDTRGYRVETRREEFAYDPKAAKKLIDVTYTDHDESIVLAVTDDEGASQMPKYLQKRVDTIIADTSY